VRAEDAASRVSRWERDVLGRVTDVFHDADGVHDRFVFDEARTPSGRPVLGALAVAESGDGVIDTYEYDELARPVGQSRLVEGLLLRTTQDLDEHGRILSTTYPDALGAGLTRVANVYDPRSGEVVEVTQNGSSVWRLRDQSAEGLPSAESLGPIERLTGYTDGGRLDTVVSTASFAGGGALPLQDLDYDYDTRGLLSARTDGLAGRSERFVHDALSRLTEVRESGVVRERYGIDALGNLTSTHDARLSYADPLHPQGATEVIGPEGMRLGYDAVGNAYRVGDLTIAYSQRNLPRVITGDKVGVVTYRYDAAGSRASKRGRDVDVTYFGLYELERRGMTLYERLSIPTPAGVVAQLERSGADGQTASRLRWLLTERQGSTETSWVVGEAPEHHRYDAYGGVLSEAGSVTGQRPSETVSHGYTGHEHEDELGLVNMGGRIYSPRLRRFLTADPIVAVPFGQGLNAYSYVMGDPMNFVDPTGWQAAPTDAEGAGPEEERAINEDAPDDELPSFGARAVVPGPASGDGPAHERASAGAAGQASAAGQGVDGQVVFADLTNVAGLLGLDLPGFDEGTGRITNFHDASRSADAMALLLAERTTVEGRIDVTARRALAAAASLGPGIGEVQDLLLLIDPRALFDDRVMAGVSLLASVVTGGGALNFAAVRAAGGGGRVIALDANAFRNLGTLRGSGAVGASDTLMLSPNVASELGRHGISATDISAAGVRVAAESPVGASVAATRIAAVLRGFGGRGAASASADALNLAEATALGADAFVTADRQVLRAFG
jgi:RHS repeat-associated protein